MTNLTLSVVVRFHDSNRTFELERALLSLLMQTYVDIEVLIVTQRFEPAQLTRLDALLAPLKRIDPRFNVQVFNYQKVEPSDARSALLNLGIQKARGRYLAFLDYDDVMQPHAYTKLIDILTRRRAAIAFGGITVKFGTLEDDYCLVRYRGAHFLKGLGLAELFQDNHCPIHSFVVDCEIVRPELLHFDESVRRAEDYQFVLRICAEYTSDFSLKTVNLGDYYLKDDGSNTVVTTDANPEEKSAWRSAARSVLRDRSNIFLSKPVQNALGLPIGDKPVTILDYLQYTREKIGLTGEPSSVRLMGDL